MLTNFILVHKLLTADVLSKRFQIEVNGRVCCQFLISKRCHVIHDTGNENFSFVVDQSVHHIDQVSHGLMTSKVIIDQFLIGVVQCKCIIK